MNAPSARQLSRASVGVAGAALVLAGLVFHETLQSASKLNAAGKVIEYDATLVKTVVVVGALLMIVALMFDRITEISLFGNTAKFGAAAAEDASKAAQQTVGDDGEDLGDIPSTDRLLRLRLRLDQKLTWLARQFVGPDGVRLEYVTPGNLWLDHYLTKEQARTLTRILTAPVDTPVADTADARTFLRGGEALVNRLRATALYQQTLALAVEGAAKANRSGGHDATARPVDKRSSGLADIIVTRDQSTFRIATVFPYGKRARITDARERLTGEDLVVIPRKARPGVNDAEERLRGDDDPAKARVVFLDELPGILAGRGLG